MFSTKFKYHIWLTDQFGNTLKTSNGNLAELIDQSGSVDDGETIGIGKTLNNVIIKKQTNEKIQINVELFDLWDSSNPVKAISHWWSFQYPSWNDTTVNTFLAKNKLLATVTGTYNMEFYGRINFK